MSVICPHCGRSLELKLKHIYWPEKHPEKAAYRCQLCDGTFDKSGKIQFSDVIRELVDSTYSPEALDAFKEQYASVLDMDN